MEKKPDHDCEFFLTTDVAVYSCECEHIEVSDKSISIEYVPLKKYQVLQSENERLLSALKELHKESYDLREHCQDRGYLDFNEPDNDGVVQFNAALENANQILNNTKSDGDAFLLHLIDVTACFVMEQNMFLATPTRKELIDKARSTFKQSN